MIGAISMNCSAKSREKTVLICSTSKQLEHDLSLSEELFEFLLRRLEFSLFAYFI